MPAVDYREPDSSEFQVCVCGGGVIFVGMNVQYMHV